MTSVLDHYDKHLAPVYSWLAGGFDDAVARGQRELTEIGLPHGDAKYAVDLGAGFGMHAIPLARQGWKVLAIDTSALLLQELRDRAESGLVMTAQDDLLHFPQHLSGEPDVVLCMGDTLTHLPDVTAVRELVASVAEHLPAGGRFVLTFRDYSQALEGPGRFIPVKSDQCRILTCFLEYNDDSIQVHDILHERSDDGWRMQVSSYRKLRLAPEWVLRELDKCGFSARMEAGISGLVRLVAVRRQPSSHPRIVGGEGTSSQSA